MPPVVVIELEDNHVIPLHVALVEPSMARVVEYFITFVKVMWKDHVSFDKVRLLYGSEVTERKWGILDGSRQSAPDAGKACVSMEWRLLAGS